MYVEQNMKMQKKGSSNSGRRAWNILHLALLWARKGDIFRNKFSISLSLLQKGVKSLRHPKGGSGALIYGERQLSFDQTPIIHVKMHRPSSLRFKMPHIPCISRHVDFDYDFEFNDNEDRIYYSDVPRKSFLKGVEDQNYDHELNRVSEEIYESSDEGIDLKAEQFIAKFYEQMKMQRQISYLQYNDVLNKSST
ncbi:uncharacterized protein LOC111404920 [Olea europaea var. sylvestris]|uniref:uncharacterized protein LOC111404920 n=1 Tax=Olea europaea var. sylvestris TaxID=158386 RepID=UPI000C1D55FF|nr:uncharacterized protein LOC111404920 [Olea europaea var. sylvestris]